eukprot:680628-Lingulodinium_polyedra.AAC.1
MEMLGNLPSQLAFLLTAMIPKGPGKPGFRPIVLFSGLFRVWARCRSDHSKEVIRRLDRSYLACGAHRAVEDTVWRQATAAEAA